MANKEDLIRESASIIEEIEDQLDKILANKRQEIEKELEAKIEQNRREAKKKINMFKDELAGEKKVLTDYRSALEEFEKEKESLKEQIDHHLAKAMEYQPQIEDLAGKTVVELKKVFELNKQLQETNLAAVSKVDSLKKDLGEKFGIIPPPPETKEYEEVQFNLDNELEKLKKIKELLGKKSAIRQELDELENNSLPEDVEASTQKISRGASADDQVEEQDEKEMDSSIEEASVSKDQEVPVQDEQPVQGAADTSVEVLSSQLEPLRKSVEGDKNIKLTYFDNNKKVILDGKDILAAIDKSIEEANNLYQKLTQTQSPKEQFFIKQEIIWHQEALREVILTAIKMCDKENAALPQYTSSELNTEKLHKILEKVSQENWSNKDYFHSFKQFASELKAAYQTRTTPWAAYLKSLVDELEID
jgi:hypothetical protein